MHVCYVMALQADRCSDIYCSFDPLPIRIVSCGLLFLFFFSRSTETSIREHLLRISLRLASIRSSAEVPETLLHGSANAIYEALYSSIKDMYY